MKTIGRHSRVTNTVKPSEQIKEYDLDHEITATIQELDDVINGCDLGRHIDAVKNEKLIIKACINHLLEKL